MTLPVVPTPLTQQATLLRPLGLSACWRHAFDALVERLGFLFARSEARSNLRAYLEGLLAPVGRKNGWQLAEAAGDETPYALQHLLGRAKWDAEAAQEDLRSYVVEHLGCQEGILALDETGFLKKGEKSAGVQRQYSGTAGRIENCQVGVFLAYLTPRGRTFLDRALYLPESWATDEDRRRGANIPEEVAFATKPAIGRAMLERALDAGVPCAWVVADEVYGSDSATRRLLEARAQPFVLTVTSGQRLWVDLASVTVKELAGRLSRSRWQRHRAGDGAKGPRLYDWALWPFKGGGPRRFRHAVLFRRSPTDGTDVAYYFVFAPPRTSLATLARVAGRRWGIEESFQSAKGEVGLDQYEVRSWPGWHRHITLALWAHAFLTVQRAEALEEKKTRGRRRPRAVVRPRDSIPALLAEPSPPA